MRGKELFSDEDWTRLVEGLRLSPRERELLRFLFEDLTEADMAERLGISNATVHTYMGRLYRKTKVRSRTQLLLLTFRRHLEQVSHLDDGGSTSAGAVDEVA